MYQNDLQPFQTVTCSSFFLWNFSLILKSAKAGTVLRFDSMAQKSRSSACVREGYCLSLGWNSGTLKWVGYVYAVFALLLCYSWHFTVNTDVCLLCHLHLLEPQHLSHCHWACIDPFNKLTFMRNPVPKATLSSVPLVAPLSGRFVDCLLQILCLLS